MSLITTSGRSSQERVEPSGPNAVAVTRAPQRPRIARASSRASPSSSTTSTRRSSSDGTLSSHIGDAAVGLTRPLVRQRRRLTRQADGEHGARLAGRVDVGRGDRAAVHLHEAADDRQPQSQALVRARGRRVRLTEALEHVAG